MEDAAIFILIFVFLIVIGSIGGIYYKNRHLVVPGKKKAKKKDRQFWSLEG